MFPNIEQICDLFFARDEQQLIKIAEEGKFDFTISSPNKKDKGRTFIHLAILNNMTKLVKVLFDSGYYDVNKRDNQGYSYLSAAVLKDNFDLVDYFIDVMNIDDNNCLNAARSIDMIKHLVDKGMNITNKDSSGNDLMQNAIKWDLLDITYWLLNNYGDNFDINERETTTGKTLLHSAVMCENISCMKYLLDKGFNVDIEDNKHMTPMMYAAKFGKVESYKYLDKYKKDKNIDMSKSDINNIIKLIDKQEFWALKYNKSVAKHRELRKYIRGY